VIQEFNKLPFVKNWYERHDKWLDFLDEADKIQAFLFLLEKFKVFSFERWMPLLERLKSKFSGEEFLEAAEKEYDHLDKKIRYIVYGHTHQPCQVPIRLVQKEARPPLQHVYLNSGTWRARYHNCRQGLGFIGWKNLTYLVFYTKEERRGEFPAFETWSGTLKTI
jgi:UDP-2,3-diacylglucosamine pyrophosphatase LpxH